jgi:hypothetical protein
MRWSCNDTLRTLPTSLSRYPSMSDEIPTPPIRPLHDVWLKPRRVFRELAGVPIGGTDYLLAAVQGTVDWFALCRGQSTGASDSVAEIIGMGFLLGPLVGVIGLHLMTAVYARLAVRLGGSAPRAQVFHVLAYGGVPMLVSLAAWLGVAFVVGRSTFLEKPDAGLDAFLYLLLDLQWIAHLALLGWSALLQVMGLSEIENTTVPRAFGLWIIGRLLVALIAIVLLVILNGLGFGGPPPAA